MRPEPRDSRRARRGGGATSTASQPPELLLSCEHGGNRVPAPWRRVFAGEEALLASHRGWDPGALAIAEHLAASRAAPLFAATTTRLLCDLNRSPNNPAVFSAISRRLPAEERHAILEAFHRPHRASVARATAAMLADGHRILHLAVHSFIPVLDGQERRVDIGILHDPRRPDERAFATLLRTALARRLPDLRIAFNAPYRGTSDGLPTTLRGIHPDAAYAGIELEINQGLLRAGRLARPALDALNASIAEAATGLSHSGASRRPFD